MTESSLRREILEQPEVLARLIEDERANVAGLANRFARGDITYLTVAARGTSDNAALYAKYLFGVMLRLPVALTAPSLFTMYHRPPDMRHSLVIGVSQSGESTDIFEVVQEARRQGVPTLAITNLADSSLAKEADEVILLHAGEEVSVAATKTYTASLAAFALLAASWSGIASNLEELARIPEMIAAVLGVEPEARDLARGLVNLSDCAVIGRGFNYATAFELALKLKELAYVRAEPYSSADFLHGPLALVDESFRAVEIAPSGAVYENLVEFTGRIKHEGARLIAISDRAEFLRMAEAGLKLPDNIPEWLSPLVAIIPGQLFALHLTLAKGHAADSPRSLSKVTRTL
jgi:glucosamine--fructose-6-phosphate aminotransferase (isomerizing)